MKIIVTEFKDHVSVTVLGENGIHLGVFTYDTYAEAKAFVSGFITCRAIASMVIQTLPMDYKLEKQ
jgi:hypothetical protein